MKRLYHWFLESLLIIFHLPIGLSNFVLPFNTVNPSQKPPIILVERWFTRNPLHYFMKRYLEKQGYTVYCINFPLVGSTFRKSAEGLHDFIEDRKLTNVILIGISSGGLTCYEYLNDFDGWKRTKLCIGLGAPFQGALLGFMMYGLEIKKELDPHGAYIASVLKRPVKHADRMYSMMAASDQMVGHAYSYLPGSQKVVIDVAGHNLLHTVWVPTYRKIIEICEKKK